MNEELKRRVEECREDFEAVRGTPFTHFFCPITHTDDDVELCKGHVVNERFGGAWVPQRKDVHGFYGSVAEADFISIVEDRGTDPWKVWTDPKLRKRHRPRLELNGEPIKHYFPKESSTTVPGQTRGSIVDGNANETICDVVVKMPSGRMADLDGDKIDLVIERDYRPAITASLIKAAHLTLFKMLGYQHVFSPTGIYLADVVSKFYQANKDTPKREIEGPLNKYFDPLSRMVSPMYTKGEANYRGTVSDNLMHVCVGASKRFFAFSVIVKVGTEMFCVFLPTDDGLTIDTYFSFINEPPESVLVKLVKFCPADDDGETRWETGRDEPQRVKLNQSIPATGQMKAMVRPPK